MTDPAAGSAYVLDHKEETEARATFAVIVDNVPSSDTTAPNVAIISLIVAASA